MSTLSGWRQRLEKVAKEQRRRRARKFSAECQRPHLEELERLLLMSATPEQETNDTLVQATALTIGQDPAGSNFFTGLGSGSIGTTSDVDYWNFNAQASDRVGIAADSANTGASSIAIELRNAS